MISHSESSSGLKKVFHIHVTSGTSAGCCYMTQSSPYEHQGTLPVGKSTDCFYPAFNLTIKLFNSIISSDPCPMLCRKIHIGQGFFNPILYLFGIRKDFRNSFKHAEILVANDQSNTSKPAFFQPYEERSPAFTILFHPFYSAKDFPTFILTNTDGSKDRNILDFAVPATFRVNAIYINIRIVSEKRADTPGFDMFISLLCRLPAKTDTCTIFSGQYESNYPGRH